MRKMIPLVIAAVVIQFSCSKNNATGPVAVAQADFLINNVATDSSFVIGTRDLILFVNKSANADSVSWNFGNGKTSSDTYPQFAYDSAGQYTVTLTAFNKNGTKSSAVKKLTALERVVKKITINSIQLNKFSPSQNGLPTFTKLNMWLEIKYSDATNYTYTANGDFVAPTIFKSPVFTNIDSSFHSSITYSPTDKVVINTPVNNYNYTSSLGTVVNLYGQDNSGTYLLASSHWSGIALSVIYGYDGHLTANKNFGLQFYVAGSPTNVVLDCQYQ